MSKLTDGQDNAVGVSGQSISVSGSIANGASLSGTYTFDTRTPVAIELPAALTGTALTFQLSTDNVTFKNLYDEFGTEVTVQVGTSRIVRLVPADWYFVKYLKVRSGTSGSPTAEGGDRTINFICR